MCGFLDEAAELRPKQIFVTEHSKDAKNFHCMGKRCEICVTEYTKDAKNIISEHTKKEKNNNNFWTQKGCKKIIAEHTKDAKTLFLNT